MSWGKLLAKKWTNMVGPSRPTISELSIYTKYAHILMKDKGRRLNLLVLGSTPEFRDWGYEENMRVSVIDSSADYHQTISRELRHKSIITNNTEIFYNQRWEDMNFNDEFDIIIGDLAIGNIVPSELPNFIHKVSLALEKDGLFLGKSFFVPDNYSPITPQELVKKYNAHYSQFHPYSCLAFDLTMYCIDENNLLDFNYQYNALKQTYEDGYLKKETFDYFKDVGWDNDMKFKFHVPTATYYLSLIKKYMYVYTIEYGEDVYSPNFPLYIITKTKSELWR